MIQEDKVKFFLELKLGLNNKLEFYKVEGEVEKPEEEMNEEELRVNS